MASSRGKKSTGSVKRKTGTRSTAGNRKGASKRKGSGSARLTPEELRAAEVRRDIRLLLFFGAMAFVMIAELGYGGAAGKAVSSFMFGIYGTPAYIVPVFTFILVLFIISNRGKRTLPARTVSLVLLLFTACAGFEFWEGEAAKADKFNAAQIYQRCAASGEGGGLIGGTAAYWLYQAFKSVGSVFVLVMIALICILVLTQFSPVARYRKAEEERIRRGDPSFMERRKLRAEESRAALQRRREAQAQEKAEREELLEQERLNREERMRRVQEKAEQLREEKPDAADLNRTVIKPAEEEEEEDFGLDEGSFLFRKREKKKKERKTEVRGTNPGTTQDRGPQSIPSAVPEALAQEEPVSRRKRETLSFADTRIRDISSEDPLRSPTGALYDEENGSDSAHGINVLDRDRNTGARAEEIRVSAAGKSRPKEKEPATMTVFTMTRDTGSLGKELQFPFEQEAASGKMRRVYAKEETPEQSPELYTEDLADAGGMSTFNAMKAQRSEEAAEEKPAEPAVNKESVSEEQLRDIEVHRDRGEQKEKAAGRTAMSGQSRSRENRKYSFPPFNLMEKGARPNSAETDRELKETAYRLQETLRTFGVNVTITDISQGPSVTRYELQPEQGVKVSKIVGLANDIKLSLAAVDIRIEAPIPGKPAIGIEVPNRHPSIVALRDILETQEFRNAKSKLAFAVGRDLGGQTVVTDIARMPHLLIAGATGSGKSVCINTIIMSLLYKASPDEVQLIMIDPKVVELSVYNGIPHLMIPVVTDVRKASAALNWAVAEMERRYKLFAAAGTRDLKGYNDMVRAKGASAGENEKVLSRIVVIVDELADLMMVAKNDVESSICRLAQLARAAGIHLIIATQRPSVDVITGLIKANMPSRIAFAVTSQVDSRTILDMAGAEKLIGKGDMLFYPQNYQKPARIQGAFISDEDVMKVVEYIRRTNTAYGGQAEEIDSVIDQIAANGGNDPETEIKGGSGYDEHFAEAGRFIIEKNKASIGMLQRVFKIGFNRAARIMDQLAEAGVVSEDNGTKARQVLMDMASFEQLLEEM